MSPSQCRITGCLTWAQDAVVDGGVVLGAASAGGQGAAGHQDHARALALDERDLLFIGAGDILQRSCLARLQMIGAGAAGDDRARRGGGLGGRAPDQLLGRLPAQPHAALRGIHRLGDRQPERPEVMPVGERGLPIEPRIGHRIAIGKRIGDDVGGGIGDPARDRARLVATGQAAHDRSRQ